MHARRTQRLMSNQIIIRKKSKGEEKERGFEFKMLRLTSEATRRRKLSEHSSGLSLSHRGQICYLKV